MNFTARLSGGKEVYLETGADEYGLRLAMANGSCVECSRYNGETVILNLAQVPMISFFETKEVSA